MRRLAVLVLALAACERQPPAPPPAPVQPPQPSLEPPEPVELQPAVAPDDVPNDPAEVVMLFVRLWDEHLAEYAPRSPRFMRAAAERTYALRSRFLAPELLANERLQLEKLRALPEPGRPDYALVSATPQGDAAVVVYRRRIAEGRREEERAVDVVRREGRWWIETVHLAGVETLPMDVVEAGRLHVVPEGHRWVDDLSTPQGAANGYAELLMRVRVEQTDLYLEGLEAFVNVCGRFLVPERIAEIERALAKARAEGIGHAAELVHQVGRVVVRDETRAYFPLGVPLDATRSTAERIDLVKVGETWRVSRVAVPHSFCEGKGVCRACAGTGAYKDRTCPACKGSGRCEQDGCEEGWVAANR